MNKNTESLIIKDIEGLNVLINKNSIKQSYHKYTSYNSLVDLKRLDFIVKEIRTYQIKTSKKKIAILDMGCGKGDISLPLASLGYNVHGADLAKESIDHLKKINPFTNATFATEDAEMLATNKTFDIVILSEIFEHLDNPQLLIQSVKKMVNENGLVIVTIPNGYGPWEVFFDIPLRFLLYLRRKIAKQFTARGVQHVQNFSLNQFKKVIDGKFNIMKVRHSDFISGIIPVLRRNKILYVDLEVADLLPHRLVSGWYFVLTPCY